MTPTEREEFEMVAKVCGIEPTGWTDAGLLLGNVGEMIIWNPRTDDGDAFRLMVKMKMSLNFGNKHAFAEAALTQEIKVEYVTDPYAATREAIWQCALECARRVK